jgi:hypothetical protein
MILVDVIKHTETGRMYTIPHGDPLPSNAYTRFRLGISEDEATRYVPKKLMSKSKC